MEPTATVVPSPTELVSAPPATTPRRLGAELVFLASAIPFGAAGFALVVAGWSTIAAFAITPLIVGVIVAYAFAVRTLAAAEGATAAALLGIDLPPPPRLPTAPGYWRKAAVVLADAGFWRRQAYLLARMVIGLPMAVAEISLLGAGLQGISAPLTYRWIPQDEGRNGWDFGIWRADTAGKAALLVPLGVAVVAFGVALLVPMAAAWRNLARNLLGSRPTSRRGGAPAPDGSHRRTWAVEPAGPFEPAGVFQPMGEHPVGASRSAGAPAGETAWTMPEIDPRRALVAHAALAAGVTALMVAIWAGTARASFWPIWVALPLAANLGVHAWTYWTRRHPAFGRRRGMSPGLAVHLGVSAVIELFLIGVWLAANRGVGGYPWPVWPLVGLAALAATHWVIVLTRRIERLDSSRAGAVAVSDDDLRRIERDLHDGAQARLVSLGMNLGLAEQKLRTDPEAARSLLTEARADVGEALGELRDLVRGIRPPLLADRGLAAAVTALADRSTLPVLVRSDLAERPPAPVETAAYFVVTEALSNAAKHAGAQRIEVGLARRGDRLRVEVSDDGHGGADPQGAGLLGLRRRVEALDGTLSVTSPPGGPTTVVAELPCAP